MGARVLSPEPAERALLLRGLSLGAFSQLAQLLVIRQLLEVFGGHELAVAVTPKHDGASTVPIVAKSGSCGACQVGSRAPRWTGWALAALGLVALGARRRRRT